MRYYNLIPNSEKKKIQLGHHNDNFRFGRLRGIFLFLEFGNLSYNKHS